MTESIRAHKTSTYIIRPTSSAEVLAGADLQFRVWVSMLLGM